MTAQVMKEMRAIKQDGRRKENHSSLVMYYEKLANIKVKR